MSKTAVLYRSKYGSTEIYAKHIAKELSADLFNLSGQKNPDLSGYQTIIYGGGLYAGGINGIKFLSAHQNELVGKNIIVYTCGIADPSNPDNEKNIRGNVMKSLGPDLSSRTEIFLLRGAMYYSKLSFLHRLMMGMLHRMMKKQPPEKRTEEIEQMLATYGEDTDFTDLSSAQPLLDFVK